MAPYLIFLEGHCRAVGRIPRVTISASVLRSTGPAYLGAQHLAVQHATILYCTRLGCMEKAKIMYQSTPKKKLSSNILGSTPLRLVGPWGDREPKKKLARPRLSQGRPYQLAAACGLGFPIPPCWSHQAAILLSYDTKINYRRYVSILVIIYT